MTGITKADIREVHRNKKRETEHFTIASTSGSGVFAIGAGGDACALVKVVASSAGSADRLAGAC